MRAPTPNQSDLFRLIFRFLTRNMRNRTIRGMQKIIMLIKDPYKKSIKSMEKKALITSEKIKPAQYMIIKVMESGLFKRFPFMLY
jgi:hypothetical protein